MKTKTFSPQVSALVLLMALESAGAAYGGISLILDPSGDSIQLPHTLLENTFLSSFLLPGIFLFTFLGILPLLLILPLIFKPEWKVFERLNIYPNYHWAWTFALYISITLISWINIEIIILDHGSVIQGVMGLYGTLMLIIVLLPGVKNFYRIPSNRRKQE